MPKSKVYVASVGFTKIGDHWERSLLDLAVEAARGAMKGTPKVRPQQVFVGNMFSAIGAGQEHLGALLASALGLVGVQPSRWSRPARQAVRPSTWRIHS